MSTTRPTQSATAFNLTPQDVADQTGFAVPTVKQWFREGQLRGARFPGGWRTCQAWVDEFIGSLTNVQASA